MKDLFRLIDQGSAELEIPPYNGGLFSSNLQHADFFHQFDIADKYLARAIDLLGTAPSLEDKAVFANVDYAGLDIRHLGSIYEGLLEYRLRYAETDMVSIRRKRGEVWIRATEYEGKTPLGSLPPERRVSKGELYLETDRHERKVTGSYYTPDYIVKYIVRETLGPIVRDKLLQAEQESQEKSEAILSIKVCDPAMGSGHFLVEATDFLAEVLLQAVMEDQTNGFLPPMEVDLVWAKREVVRHCIYGVDSNPLAVELAKVSLWLATISRDKPLSFLDHHLKCGDSVVGSRIVDLGWLPGQRPEQVRGSIEAPFGYLEKILTRLDELEGITDETVEDVKEKEALFRQVQESDEYRRIKALADVHIGISFTGPDFEKIHSSYMELANEAYHGDPEKWKRKFSVAWARTAAAESKGRRVFHWELEFPDIFFRHDDEAPNPGFDAIVGNPPYVRIHGLADEETKSYLRSTYETAWMNFDLYVIFVERGLELISAEGRFGFILPTKFFYTEYGKPLRNLLREGGHIAQVLDFGHNQIFPGETTYTCVLILSKTARESFIYFQCGETPNPQEDIAAALADRDATDLITKA
ncbi:MAG: Eco57I restriction-modification methylase domain-containing protein, partial [bacterium]